MSIHSISLTNFKSIREAKDIRFEAVNILIGPNGVGKTNLISFFKLLNNIMNKNLQMYVKTTGRANSYLYFGAKKSTYLEGEISFLNPGKNLSNSYQFKLIPTQEGGFIFEKEFSNFNRGTTALPHWTINSYTPKGSEESSIPGSDSYRNRYLKTFFRSLRVFHFHDTSPTARVKDFCSEHDSEYLREDASNLAAFLYKLSQTHSQHYNIIEKVIQSVAPFFNRFDLKPDGGSPPAINLKWLEKGSDSYFDANHLSDGTLRFICLATLLLQPEPPSTIIIDEPELGLHPSAIQKLSSMIKSASVKTQIIVSTQSIHLVDQFSADDIIVVEREDNQTVFKRQSEEALSAWREEYSLGELWSKNVLGGTP
ncbi:MAG: AAA family ATPase [Bacteroidetes bacterium]|nr:AAA family ATPase [Bacteroidota bacterium]